MNADQPHVTGDAPQAPRVDALLGRAASALLRGLAIAALAGSLAAWIRYGWIERDDLGQLCDGASAPAWCAARLLVIKGFVHHVFGYVAAASAVIAGWRRSWVLAGAAIAVGTVGMVLYDFPWSGFGALGGALVLARLQGEWHEDAGAEHDR
jgi:hypothetical protein